MPLEAFWRPGRPQELKLLKLLKLSKLLNPGASGRGFGRPISLFQRPLEASGFKSFQSFESFESFKSFNSWGLQEPSQGPLQAFWRPGRPQESKHLKLLKLFWEMLWLASGGQKAQITLYIKVSLTYIYIYIYMCVQREGVQENGNAIQPSELRPMWGPQFQTTSGTRFDS